MRTTTNFLHRRVSSIGFALEGIVRFFREEPNAWVHLAATAIVIVLSFFFKLSGAEKLALVIVTGLVWIAEAFNTVIERVMDHISPGPNARVKFIKDLSAGVVLLAALTAAITGATIFIPKLF